MCRLRFCCFCCCCPCREWSIRLWLPRQTGGGSHDGRRRKQKAALHCPGGQLVPQQPRPRPPTRAVGHATSGRPVRRRDAGAPVVATAALLTVGPAVRWRRGRDRRGGSGGSRDARTGGQRNDNGGGRGRLAARGAAAPRWAALTRSATHRRSAAGRTWTNAAAPPRGSSRPPHPADQTAGHRTGRRGGGRGGRGGEAAIPHQSTSKNRTDRTASARAHTTSTPHGKRRSSATTATTHHRGPAPPPAAEPPPAAAAADAPPAEDE